MQKNKKHKLNLKIINKIQKIRSKNNINWMNLLRVALKHDPKKTSKLRRWYQKCPSLIISCSIFDGVIWLLWVWAHYFLVWSMLTSLFRLRILIKRRGARCFSLSGVWVADFIAPKYLNVEGGWSYVASKFSMVVCYV